LIGSGSRGRRTVLIAAAAALGTVACEGSTGNQAAAVEAAPSERQEVRSLDSAHPSLVLGVAEAEAGEDRAFVAVEIAEVTNPGRLPLSFQVAFRPAEGGTERLGGFSLYPADNPGRFIVAAGGKARGRGEIVLTIEDAEAEGMAKVRVGVSSLGFAPSRN
jgi:hypothetical protein